MRPEQSNASGPPAPQTYGSPTWASAVSTATCAAALGAMTLLGDRAGRSPPACAGDDRGLLRGGQRVVLRAGSRRSAPRGPSAARRSRRRPSAPAPRRSSALRLGRSASSAAGGDLGEDGVGVAGDRVERAQLVDELLGGVAGEQHVEAGAAVAGVGRRGPAAGSGRRERRAASGRRRRPARRLATAACCSLEDDLGLVELLGDDLELVAGVGDELRGLGGVGRVTRGGGGGPGRTVKVSAMRWRRSAGRSGAGPDGDRQGGRPEDRSGNVQGHACSTA